MPYYSHSCDVKIQKEMFYYHSACCILSPTSIFVGSCLATKVFIGNMQASGRGGSSQSRPVMDGGQLPTNQLHDINWGALDHASHAPQLMSCNYYIQNL